MIARRNNKNQDNDFLIPEDNDDISFSNITSSQAKNKSDNNASTTVNNTTATSSTSTISDDTTDTTVSNANDDNNVSTDNTTSTDTDKAADADKSTTDDSTDNIPDENGDIAYVDTGSIAKAKKNKRKQRIFIIIVAAILVILLVFLVLVKVNHKGITQGNQYASTANTSNTDSSSDNSSSGDDATKTYLENTLGVQEYYSQARSKTVKDDKLKAQSDSDAVAGAPVNSIAALTSSASDPDFTDDPAKAYNDDGTLNTHYSYLSAEYVDETIRDDIERLVNPVYGEWTKTQDSGANGDDWRSLEDMMSENMKNNIDNSNGNVQSVLPLYANWDSQSFNENKFDNRNFSIPTIGIVNMYDCKYYIQSVQGDYIECTVPVKYTITNVDMTTTDVSKTMTITYSVNYSNYNKDSNRRILIDSIQQ